MKTYKALIVDDEKGNRTLLKSLLLKYCTQISQILFAQSVREAEDILKKNPIDVVFLDIEMPGGNGFDLLNKFNEIDFKIIFVTAYEAYALKAIKYSALDYLLKPIDKDELIEAVNKLDNLKDQNAQLNLLTYNLRATEDRRIALATKEEVHFVKVNDIIRLQAEANYTRVFLKNESPLLLSGNIGHYEKLLNDQRFYRSHQSHLINMIYVKKFVKKEGGYFVMSDDSHVPVSRLKKEEVKRLLINRDSQD
ncbi:MAG: LytTR family DNA-binding domain-containing protein [Bacteroidota bacterium]